MITLPVFLATATPCDDLRVPFRDLAVYCDAPRPGVIYHGDTYIERASEGTYTVDLYNSGISGTQEECAAALYGWCVTECAEDMGASEDVAQFVATLQNAMGELNFARAVLTNMREANPAVCHMHDYCDANQCALDVAGGDIDAAADLYSRARPFLGRSA